MPIFLFALAGGMLFGGAAVLDEANHRRAAEQLKRRQKLEEELLTNALNVQDLRRQARDAGLDPDQVVAGYDALRKGDITLEQVQRILKIAA